MLDTVRNIGWSMVFSLIGGLIGMVLVLIASLIVPGLINRLTPDIDEHRSCKLKTAPGSHGRLHALL